MDAIDAITNPSLHHPDKGIVELRFVYSLEDNAVQLLSRLGEPIFALKLNSLPESDWRDRIIELLKTFAVKVRNDVTKMKGAKNIVRCRECGEITWTKEGQVVGHKPNCTPEPP
jgi:hypothetical protein